MSKTMKEKTSCGCGKGFNLVGDIWCGDGDN